MAEDRLKVWETLFQRALKLIDSVGSAGVTLDDWSFGGGTVLCGGTTTGSARTSISSSLIRSTWDI
jgi:hypothetical protein